MVKIKSASEITTRYKESIGNVPTRYKTGVSNTTTWKENAIAGQDLYETQMQNSTVLKRRKTGLEAVSNDDWKKAASETGSTRIGAGMTASLSKREANYEPYRKAIEETTLAARTADPETNIDNRVKPLATKLHNLKMGT